MAGASYVLDKGYKVLSTYNSSAAAGVTPYRCVKTATGQTIDLNATAATLSLGVVQEAVDAAKVATGKVVADVRMLGITKVFVTTAASLVIGSKVMAGTGGGVLLATSTNFVVGIVVGFGGTLADGDIVDILLTPGMVA